VSPAQPDRVFRFFAGEQTVDEARRVAVPTADTIVDIEFGCRRLIGLAVDPGNRAPGVTVGRVDFAKRSRHYLHLRVLLRHGIDHAEENTRIELGLRVDLRSRNAEAQLKI